LDTDGLHARVARATRWEDEKRERRSEGEGRVEEMGRVRRGIAGVCACMRV
jgi:hypothetical protein